MFDGKYNPESRFFQVKFQNILDFLNKSCYLIYKYWIYHFDKTRVYG